MFISWLQIKEADGGKGGALATFLVKVFSPELLFSMALEGFKLS